MNIDELFTVQMHNRTWAMGSSYKHTMPAKDARMPILWVWTTCSWSSWASGMDISHIWNVISDIVLCVLTMCMRHRMYVGIEQNIVNLAGSTSDFVNGLDMNSSSIRAQILLQNFQGKLLTDACHCIQSSIKMASRLLILITGHLVMFSLLYFFSNKSESCLMLA